MVSIELQSLGLPHLAHNISVDSEVRSIGQPPSTISGRQNDNQSSAANSSPPNLSRVRASFIVASVAGITFLNTLGQSLLVVAIPRIAQDLNIPPSLIQWPVAVASLTLGCTLLVVGAIADVVGNRPVFLTGCFLHLIFGLGCSLVQTGTQLIAFRALQGLALSLCLPTSVGIITKNFGEGRGRNFAFAFFGGGNPTGYALGLLLGGIFVDTVGWRYAYYLSIALNAMIFASAFFSLPHDSGRASLDSLRKGVDWVGLFLLSADLAILSYVLASITSSSSLSPRRPLDIALLILALLLIPSFVFWVGRQENHGRPAVIPNSLWRKAGFSSACLATFLTWAMFNALAFFATLLMQEIQHVSALQTSLRFLPLVVVSVLANLVAGYLVDKVAASKLAFGATVLSAVAPILLAVLSPEWSYWKALFPAMCLVSFSCSRRRRNTIRTAELESNKLISMSCRFHCHLICFSTSRI